MDAKKFLQNNLFTAIKPLAEAILHIRMECCNFVKMSFIDVTKIEKLELNDFFDAQMKAFTMTSELLYKFKENFTPILCIIQIFTIITGKHLTSI